MTKTASKIRLRAKLFRPAATAKVGSWTFLTLPKDASAKLPSRGMTTVEGTINGFPFRATREPDGQRSHWLRVNRKMREAAGADAGDVVTLEIAPSGEEPEPRVPADLRKALAAAPKARALWSDITPIARAFGAAARAFSRSAGTLGSGSSPDGAMSTVTPSPAAAPPA